MCCLWNELCSGQRQGCACGDQGIAGGALAERRRYFLVGHSLWGEEGRRDRLLNWSPVVQAGEGNRLQTMRAWRQVRLPPRTSHLLWSRLLYF